MDLQKLKNVSDFAELNGFIPTIVSEEYATFVIGIPPFNIEVVYDLNRLSYSKTPVYIDTSAVFQSDNLDTILTFKNCIQVAVRIAEKLKVD